MSPVHWLTPYPPLSDAIGHRTLLMGVLNVTPDSFSDGGECFDLEAAVTRGRRLIADGADILDVGGESTRPGSEAVDEAEECRRVLPVIERLVAETSTPISIDTQKSAVAKAALEVGAGMVNDISGLRADPRLAEVVAEHQSPLIVMHIQGTPRSMQQHPHYEDLIGEIVDYLEESIARAVAAGLPAERIVVDPGIGFGKTLAHNLEILRRLDAFRTLGRPILVGPSRKSFIGQVLDRPVEERLWGTAASVALAIARGADLVRVHDVAPMAEVAKMVDAIVRPG